MSEEQIRQAAKQAAIIASATLRRRREEASKKADQYIGKDGGPPTPDTTQALDELSEMTPAEYGRRREAIAEKTGIARKFLDDEYRERRKAAKEEGGGKDLMPDPEPWDEPVNGDELLAEIRDAATGSASCHPR
jgi:hypothetical protein